MKNSILKSEFIRDALSLSGGTAVAQSLALGFLPVLTRIYTPADFGVFTLYMSIVSVLSVFATMNIEKAIILPNSNRDALYLLLISLASSFILSIIIAVVIMFNVSNIAELMGDARIAPLLYLIPVSVFLVGGYQGLRFWQMRQCHFKLIATGLPLSVGLGGATSVSVAMSSGIGGGSGLIAGEILASLVKFIFLCNGLFHNKLYRKMSTQAAYRVARRYRKLSITLTISYGIATAYGKVPVLATGVIFGNTALGHLGLAERIVSAPSALIANAIGDVYRQRAAETWRETGRFDDHFKRTIFITSLVGVPVFMIGIIVAPTVFSTVFGPEWHLAGEFAQILLVGSMFSFIMSPVDKGAVIVGAFRYIFWWHIARLCGKIVAVVAVVVSYLSIKEFLSILVAFEIMAYVFDVQYEYKLAKNTAVKT